MAISKPSSKKVDEAVALHVLSWRQDGERWFDSDVEVGIRPFSRDLTAAWEVVDRVCEEGFRLQLDGSRLWLARFYKSAAHTLETRAYSATAGNPAEAICLAALAFKGVTSENLGKT